MRGLIREIGVFVGSEGAAASPGEAEQLRIYRRKQGVWQIDREMKLDLGQAKDLAAMRRAMGAVVAFLGECGLVAAENFQGAVLHELEKAGKGMWEVSGLPEMSLFEHILTEEESAGGTDANGAETVYPVLENRGDGKVFISIAELQRSDGGLTSKQVLLPIFQKGNFREMEVLCVHVPPWLEAEAICRNWTFTAKKNERNEVVVMLTALA